MSTRSPLVPERAHRKAELDGLLAEIPGWDDATLLHMHKRFSTSRLFRRHHDPAGDLTPGAKMLQEAAGAELARRGLTPLS